MLTSYFFAYQFIANEKFNFLFHLEEIILIYLIHQILFKDLFRYINENTRLRGSIGTSYLAPNGYQLSKSDYLEAETGKSYEIGIDHRFKNLDLDFDITFI